jgi:hypothetical protein
MILGPVAGWGVDRYGSKLIALIGFLAICPGLFLLVIPTGPATTSQILSLIAILGFNGYMAVFFVNIDVRHRWLALLQ